MINILCKGRKKIVCLFNSFISVSGGDIRFIEVFKRIKTIDKIIITPLIGKNVCKTKKLNATYIQTTSEVIFRNVAVIYLVRILKALFLKVELNNVDYLYSTSDFLPDVLPAFLFKKNNRSLKWIQMVHHVIPFKRDGALTDIFSFYGQRLSFFLIKRYADLVITVNPKVKENLEKMGFVDNRIMINSNGVDINYFKSITPTGKKTYDGIFFGRLHSSKGIFDLVRIWAVVNKAKPSKLGIIGTGNPKILQELTRTIKRYGLSNNIDVLGYLDDSEAFDIVKSSKVFLFPSHEEGFGIAILEAMACGLPVVAWDLSVYKSVFPQGIVRVPIGNIKKCAKEVLELLTNHELYETVSNGALEVASKYDWEQVAQNELILIKCLTKGK